MANKDATTQNIALTLLWGFIISLAVLMIVNLFIYKLDISVDKVLRKDWFDLMKNALLLLGTALTTVIGYYFGQREGALKAEQAKNEIEKTESKAASIVEEVRRQRDEAVKEAAPTKNDPPESDTSNTEESGQIQIPQ